MADIAHHSVSVAGIVVDQNNAILAIQRRDNLHWEPPGGVLEINETPQDGVRREILEETGITVDVGDLSGVYKNMNIGVIALVFKCTAMSGQLIVSNETRQAQWIPLSEAERLMNPSYFIRVSDAFLSETPVRSHDGQQLLTNTSARHYNSRPREK
ncbi:NUDIX hydrolase [Pseudonocardia sp. ICBG601]|uniref:NUDIX hydrolase n=1 Tax=Pseudonocardia sp. ICBG601 TaxID=2846759 RepID=UPI001CF67A52|nr:NUDIX hydrolase [Pseudonocardia sp. ICBG601]